MSNNWIPTKSPGFAGAALGLLAGIALICWSLWSYLQPTAPPLPQSIAMLAVGVVESVSCLYAMRRVRIAWAFSLSLNGTALMIFVFGAARVSRAVNSSLAVGFIPAAIFLTITVLLAMSAEQYD